MVNKSSRLFIRLVLTTLSIPLIIILLLGIIIIRNRAAKEIIQGYPWFILQLNQILNSGKIPWLLVVLLIVGWLIAAAILYFLMQQIQRLSPRMKVSLSSVLAIGVIVWFVFPLIPTKHQAAISIDAETVEGNLPNLNFSQGGEIEMVEVGLFERTMDHIAFLEPGMIRIDHLYDYYDVYSVTDGKPHYDWTNLDRVVDTIIAAGAEPLMSLSYMPEALGKDTVYGPPSDYDQWEELIYQTVYHYNVERDLNITYWEVWNEPNIPSFWAGSVEEYYQLYRASVQGALRADPTIKIGGPATASLEPWQVSMVPFIERPWFAGLAHYASENNLRLDFLSWHYYDSDVADFERSVRLHQQWARSADPQPELLLTEWNWSASVPHFEFDDGHTVAYVPAVVQQLDETALSHCFFFEPMDSSRQWEGRWGMVRADGMPKPAYNSFLLLSQLDGDRLPVNDNHPAIGAIASRQADTIHVLVWHYQSGHTEMPLSLSIQNLAADVRYRIDIQGVDHDHGNPYTENTDLFVDQFTLTTGADGTLTTTLTIPENGIRLLTLVPAGDD